MIPPVEAFNGWSLRKPRASGDDPAYRMGIDLDPRVNPARAGMILIWAI